MGRKHTHDDRHIPPSSQLEHRSLIFQRELSMLRRSNPTRTASHNTMASKYTKPSNSRDISMLLGTLGLIWRRLRRHLDLSLLLSPETYPEASPLRANLTKDRLHTATDQTLQSVRTQWLKK